MFSQLKLSFLEFGLYSNVANLLGFTFCLKEIWKAFASLPCSGSYYDYTYKKMALILCMWCVYRLSGESPFQGDSDSETLALVTAAKWEFDEESFEDITEQAKHFISSLLQKNARLDTGALGHPVTSTLHVHTHTKTRCPLGPQATDAL